ncbi:hypothetical protein [Bacillus subtilis]|uniref:hypothetical protein n=1 Tax=Bacillus subtilis TaxID=1423 RepID=UPI0021D81E80|nr:hypothetical protein [Bacillus subtilis]
MIKTKEGIEKMNGIEKFLEEQSFEYLKDCVGELEDWRLTGTLKQGNIRGLHEKFNSNITQLHMVGEKVYREVALRCVNKLLK